MLGRTVSRQRLDESVEKLLTLVEVFDEDPFVLTVRSRVVHVSEDPTHAVDGDALSAQI